MITKVTAVMLTPKLRAKAGITGEMTPYPSAIMTLAALRIQTSRGIPAANPLSPGRLRRSEIVTR